MKDYQLQDFTNPVVYLDCATDDSDLLTVLTGQQGEHWVPAIFAPDFFKWWHWN